MKVALLQTELHWEQPDANRAYLAQALSALEPTDLVVLPEMFNTGFSMRSEDLAETMVSAKSSERIEKPVLNISGRTTRSVGSSALRAWAK